MAVAQAPRFTLIGGGLGGALLAVYLGRRGYSVDLFERRPDPASGQFTAGGRSINLALSTRGIHALEQVGLADEVLREAVPMRGRMIHTRGGGLHFQPYDKDPLRCIYSIGRGYLNSVTIEAARRMPNVRVRFDCRCVDADLDGPVAKLVDQSSGEAFEAGGDVLVGVDGAFSAVRRSMQRLDRFDYSQTYLGHGYKELTIPPGPDGGFRMERTALHIWPRESFMMIALPNGDASFTCTLFLPFQGRESFANLKTEGEVRGFFERCFPDAVPLMPTLLDDFAGNPTGSMVTMRCRPWHHGGKAALLGDAAHAVVPFYGQGMNAAFEDCAVLDACLGRHGPDWAAALAEYDHQRQPHVDALADLALANFIEMRDLTGTPWFRGRKKLERTIHRWLPRWFTPLYTLVSFTRTPYAAAVSQARRQDRAIGAVLLGLVFVLLTLGFSLLWPRAVLRNALLALVTIGLAVWAASHPARRRAAELRQVGARLE